MKQRTKGILAFAFLGGILLTSTVMFALPPPDPTMTEEEMAMEEQGFTKTGTLMDNFAEEDRNTFCGTSTAVHGMFVKEYEIPTVCTQPLAIKVAPNGIVWFVETNSGDIGKFDPDSEVFTEFENKDWPDGARTMSWGIDYSPDGSIWYTDPTFDSIWRYDISSGDYNRLGYPSESLDNQNTSLPQKLQVIGSDIIVNDFTGGKITIFDIAQGIDGEVVYTTITSPLTMIDYTQQNPDGSYAVQNSFTSDFALDKNDNLWYTNWVPGTTGALIKFDLPKYINTVQDGTDEDMYIQDFIEFYNFPGELNTANGLSTDSDGNIWIADTSSSYFFKFDPLVGEFTNYITSHPPKSAYGNYSSVIKSPISRPYWTSMNENNQLVFNEQTSNRFGVFDIKNESLVEYSVPSQNPGWGDCGFVANGQAMIDNDCGVAQVFGFDIADDKIWFTEWAENKIGVIDTSKELPIVSLEFVTDLVTLKKGEKSEIDLIVTYADYTMDYAEPVGTIVSSNTAPYQSFPYITATYDYDRIPAINNQETITVTISADERSLPGLYKLLIGIDTDDVVVSKFIDVVIES